MNAASGNDYAAFLLSWNKRFLNGKRAAVSQKLFAKRQHVNERFEASAMSGYFVARRVFRPVQGDLSRSKALFGDGPDILNGKVLFASGPTIGDPEKTQASRRLTGTIADQLHGFVYDIAADILNKLNAIVDRAYRAD